MLVLEIRSSFHLEFFQHGRLVCEPQVAAADAELLGEVVEVHLRRNTEDYGTRGMIGRWRWSGETFNFIPVVWQVHILKAEVRRMKYQCDGEFKELVKEQPIKWRYQLPVHWHDSFVLCRVRFHKLMRFLCLSVRDTIRTVVTLKICICFNNSIHVMYFISYKHLLSFI